MNPDPQSAFFGRGTVEAKNTTTFTFTAPRPSPHVDGRKGIVEPNTRYLRYGAGEVVLEVVVRFFVATLAAGFVMTLAAALFLALQ